MTPPISTALAYAFIWGLFTAVAPARAVVVEQFRRLPSAFRRYVWIGVACGGLLVAADAGALVALGAFRPSTGWRPTPVAVSAAIVWAAVVATTEEMIVRGLLLKRLRLIVGDAAAVLVTAAVFAGMHVGRSDLGLSSLTQYFVDGILLAWMVIATGSIWAATGFHLAKNAVVALLLGGSHRLVEPWLVIADAERPLWVADVVSYAVVVPVCLLVISARAARSE